MVSIVLVSHSAKLAEATAELAGLMAKQVRILGAGGMEDGDFGTSFNRIYDAIEQVYSPDGVLVLMDMGSSVMTTEMVLEEMEEKKVCMADAPFVEGAIAAAVEASFGSSLEEVVQAAEDARGEKKL
ncbi:MAG: PTS-dependent dihydroxyacetone kinase phosphotransferase subunit DhaM [Lachnospiraceae bacterium]|nr:PTS-dependent dihydroxyacetone kinase phosphotransferase subunit DhaM [Lachnospiraceae bacterium]